MTTFVHRDRRLVNVEEAFLASDARIAEIEAAIAGFPPDGDAAELAALQASRETAIETGGRISAERDQLVTDRFEVSDEAALAIAADWIWQTTSDMLASVAADPALVVRQMTPGIAPDTAAAIEALPRAPGLPRAGFLDEVLAAGGAETLGTLTGFALGQWLRQPLDVRNYPFRDIGVVLPLRLETLFDEQADGSWLMSLRVVPDEPSIRRDQTKVTALEAEFLRQFWNRARAMVPAASTPADWLEHPEGIVAWEELAARVTAPRAAWMVAAFPAQAAGDAFTVEIPPERIGDPEPELVIGLPPALDVWLVETNGNEGSLGMLWPTLADLTMSVPSHEGALDDWLVSWTRAQEVGMGGEFSLPAGCTPETIAALYVYGIGEDHPAELFRSHADAGILGFLRLAAATNSVQGAPAADLAGDADTWRSIALQRLAGALAPLDIAAALSGDKGELPSVPGGSGDAAEGGRLVRALWPALLGHYFRDLWKCAEDADRLGLWAARWLAPEGPFVPLRIGAQPYGLLPVTALQRWEPLGDSDDQVEARILDALARVTATWAAAAEAQGTVVDADTRRLLDLLARPGVSARYAYRSFLPAERLAAAYPGVSDFVSEAARSWDPAVEVMRHSPARVYLAVGHPAPLRLPLIGARRLPLDIPLRQVIELLYEGGGDFFADFVHGEMGGVVPDSLLIRLLMHSVFLTKAWYVQSALANTDPLLNPPVWFDTEDLTPLEALQNRFPSSFRNGLGGETITELVKMHHDTVRELAAELDQYVGRGRDPLDPGAEVNVLELPTERHAELERALRATLDTATHRIDPWVTGIAWRRLDQHAQTGRARHRIGAYGWLDGPFRGTPGPNRAGRLHAPSHAQAMTSIILRDKHLSSKDELAPDGRNIWEMELSSASVRLAVEMAEDVRLGFHIFEVVGRRVEGIVARPDRVRALRKEKPLRPERPDARDVCHGLAALDALLAGSVPGVLSEDAARLGEQMQALREVKAALEAYSDLLVAEGVHQVVSGHADIAAEVMDAAAGFSRPPPIEFVRTPPSGYRLATSVLAVLPFRPPVAAGHPLTLVDASLAAFLEEQFGAPARWEWRLPENGGATVKLSDLGLAPLDTVLIPEDFLIEAVRAVAGVGEGRVEPPPAHRLIRELAAAVGLRPATHADIARAPDVAHEVLRQSELALGAELFDRYSTAYQSALAFSVEIDEPAGPEPSDAERIAWLRRALAWGVTGPADPAARKRFIGALFAAEPPTSENLRAFVAHAKATLSARLSTAPAIDAESTPKLPPADLARALAGLAAPDARLAILARWPKAALVDAAQLTIDAPDASLDSAWLTITAPVRPTLARLEALQLEAGALAAFEPLVAWTNSPGDPWQSEMIEENIKLRKQAGVTKMEAGRFVAGYGPAGVWAETNIAVAIIDQFSEAIPMADRITYAAFGFNAPAARAPQAILLAVPPRSDRQISTEDLLQILKETRQLVRVRAARLEDVAHPVAPGLWLQAAGPLRMRFDTGTQYTR